MSWLKDRLRRFPRTVWLLAFTCFLVLLLGAFAAIVLLCARLGVDPLPYFNAAVAIAWLAGVVAAFRADWRDPPGHS